MGRFAHYDEPLARPQPMPRLARTARSLRGALQSQGR
jgi:hypothetical protein